MNKEFENNLRQSFPNLFIEPNIRYSINHFGFEHDDGWYKIVFNLMQCIDNYIKNNPQLEIPKVSITQVKEKFGTLRFYYNGGDENIDGMVWFAEHLSGHICEICGEAGENKVVNSWYKTTCEKHTKERMDNQFN